MCKVNAHVVESLKVRHTLRMQSILAIFATLPAVLKALVALFGMVGVTCTVIATVISPIPACRPTASTLLAFGADVVKLIDRANLLALRFGIVLLVLLSSGCAMFGTPTVKTGQCFQYCLEVQLNATGEPAAVCYGDKPAMLAAQKSFALQGRKATVRK